MSMIMKVRKLLYDYKLIVRNYNLITSFVHYIRTNDLGSIKENKKVAHKRQYLKAWINWEVAQPQNVHSIYFECKLCNKCELDKIGGDLTRGH